MEITEEIKLKLYKIFYERLVEIVAREPAGDASANWGLSARIEKVWGKQLRNYGIISESWFLNPPKSDFINDPLCPHHRWIAINEELAMKIIVLGELP